MANNPKGMLPNLLDINVRACVCPRTQTTACKHASVEHTCKDKNSPI